MNRRQQIVQAQFLSNEEAVIKRLKQVYAQSTKDITKKISVLDSSIAQLQKAYADIGEDGIGELAAAFLKGKKAYTPEEAKETLQSMIQAKVYQRKYQAALQKQVGSVLDKMHDQEFKTVSEYLQKCYEDGFIGTLYDLQGQGIPMCFPLDQEAMVRAVQLDSKISHGLYSRLGEDVAMLKKRITAEVSRSISTGMTYKQIAQQLAGKTNIGYYNAIRIARTEGHRIQVQGTMDACYKAKDRGADVVKQWDSTLDAKTRDSHVRVDGEVRELDEKFSNGLMFPGDPDGEAAEVINCRCALLQRARWALDSGFTKMNNFTGQLEEFESPASYEEFKKGFFSDENREYMKYIEQMETKYKTRDFAKVLAAMSEPEYKHYSELLKNNPLFNTKAAKGKPTFTPAQTKQEAEEFAKQFGVEADYSKYSVEVANAINETMSEVVEVFGNHALDGLSVIRAYGKGEQTQAWGGYSETQKRLAIRGVSGNNALAKLGEKLRTKYPKGFFSTSDDMHIIRHEIGHAVHDVIGGWADREIQEYMRGKIAETAISYYAGKDKYELVAECIAEYLGGNPRTEAKEIVEILKKSFARKFK